ncbi:MAG: hypothetical protein R3F49_00655 [Planctomycetota bacterium]
MSHLKLPRFVFALAASCSVLGVGLEARGVAPQVDSATPKASPGDDDRVPPPVPEGLDEGAVIARCVELLIALQEDLTDPAAPLEARREWPYEGVYRERAGRGRGSELVIPLGYRVGGTSIVSWALLSAPGYAEDARARAAVAKGAAFVLEQLATEGMRPGFNGGYDVRGWGHAYALWFLLQLRAHDAVPEGQAPAVSEWIPALVKTLEATEIRPGGGWNYSRQNGFDKPGAAASPFMTGPTLLALFEAQRQGVAVDGQVVERALGALSATRIGDVLGGADDTFSYGYSRGDQRSGRPGAMGRITSAEVALYLAGRSDTQKLTSGVQAFVEHWQQLEARRRKDKTHLPPYGVAPYYVYFAHYHTALAITLLPEAERAAWRTKYLGRLYQSRLESGGWNDRVFDRSESYGTAMALLSLLAPSAPALARWAGPASSAPGSR